jgi:DNA replication and repair protein RecF
MRLEKLKLRNYRNIEVMDFTPGVGVNVFGGNNAQGKTNILDAIYLLAHLNSFRTSKRRQLIQRGRTQCYVEGAVTVGGVSQKLGVGIGKNGFKISLDGASLSRSTDFFKGFCVVLFSPDGVDYIRGSPADRRKFIDRCVFRRKTSHLDLVRSYNKTLKSRNRCLKEHRYDLADAYTAGLANFGSELVNNRLEVIEDLKRVLPLTYRNITGIKDDLKVSYLADWQSNDSRDTQKLRHDLEKSIRASSKQEQSRGHTICGPHTDDVLFEINNFKAADYSSQGQVRSLILSVVMAEFSSLSEMSNDPPVVLLDDISSELDEQRRKALFDHIQRMDGQVFVTTTDIGFLETSMEKKMFYVKNGTLQNYPQEKVGSD